MRIRLSLDKLQKMDPLYKSQKYRQQKQQLTRSVQWRNFKFRAPLQKNHPGPLLPNKISVSRTSYWWVLKTEAP